MIPQLDETSISWRECEAIRQLDEDPSYGRSEIAFMFEISDSRTVARHADAECSHAVSEEERLQRRYFEARRQAKDQPPEEKGRL
jgi:hypothetical protein